MADIIVPSPGESVTEAEIGSWLVEDGSWVETDQEVVSLESEKATLEVTAPASGILKILVQDGEEVEVGAVIGKIDESAQKPEGQSSSESNKKEKPEDQEKEKKNGSGEKKPVKDQEGPGTDKDTGKDPGETSKPEPSESEETDKVKITPVARKMMEEYELSVEDILSGLKRIGKKEVEYAMSAGPAIREEPRREKSREKNSEKMSLLRRKLAERLVAVKNETAMLTTFNEVDMSAVIEIRNQYKAKFQEKHGIKLGFMSFFTQAASRALSAFPQINSMIDGQNLVTFDYHDIGIAVQTPKGLMVPVIRNVESLSLPEIEIAIAGLAEKARNNKISIDDMDGGTFSITNGGVFGSLLSTPILNPPQSSILGMHNIVERPVAINGQVAVRPMMYLALSYDHRLVDGKDSVGFLKRIKELIENPYKLLTVSGEPDRQLLGL
jgi:2-oxoglutarate dehydrogenase E2 component (dihydrolipoamide succinyltransferase)